MRTLAAAQGYTTCAGNMSRFEGASAPQRPSRNPQVRHQRIREEKEAAEKNGDLLTGGCVLRRRPQLIFENHLCCLTSDAPVLLPRRVVSRLSRRRVTISLQDLERDHVSSEFHKNAIGDEARTPTLWGYPGSRLEGA